MNRRVAEVMPSYLPTLLRRHWVVIITLLALLVIAAGGILWIEVIAKVIHTRHVVTAAH